MFDIRKPLHFPELDLIPAPDKMFKLSLDIQQTLALLSGYDGQGRRLIRVSETGTLFSTSPRVKDIANITATSANYLWSGSDIPIGEVLIKSNPNNADLIWVNVDEAAAADTGYPLASGDTLILTLTNLSNLHLKIIADTEKAILIYTR